MRGYSFLWLLVLLFCASMSHTLRAQDGSGKQFGIFDVWEGHSTTPPDGQNRIYRLGRVITFKVANLDGWLMTEIGRGRLPVNGSLSPEQVKILSEWVRTGKDDLITAEIRNSISDITREYISKLYPVVDGVDVPAVSRLGHTKVTGPKNDTIHYLRYRIKRDSSKSAEWNEFLNTSSNCVVPSLTLAFESQQGQPPRQLETLFKSNNDSPRLFTMELYPVARMLGVALVIIAILLLLWWFTPRSEILRDTNQPLRPDGTFPWSLSRAQMAFWFMLVVASFLFLWVVNQSFEILNSTALTLIGIGSGTALGAAAISSVTRDEAKIARADSLYWRRRDVKWKTLKEQVIGEHEMLKLELDTLPHDAAERPMKEEQFKRLSAEKRFFSRGWCSEILFDWMTENGVVSFHRFQMLAWTLVLGVVFLYNVVSHLRVPAFDATLLALTGISAGTYIGFKFPTTKTPESE